MLIDTHCHLSKDYYDDIAEIMKENKAAGVFKIIVSGCDKKGIREVLDLASKYDDIFVTIGYHPEEVDTVSDIEIEELKKSIKANKKVVGLGEIGLDYYYVKDNKEKQKALFEKQLKIAQELKIPVVIHSRDAVKDTIDILKKYKVKGVIHCFSGSLEVAEIYIKMGYKLGIGGIVTFKNSKLGEVVSKVGLDNIVLETDSPYLAPEPFRGKTNSSKYLKNIAEKIAEICSVNVDEVSIKTGQNAIDVFDLQAFL